MSDTILQVLLQVVVGSVMATVVGVILRFYLDSKTERLRADLESAAFERQIRYSKLHEKRAEVVEEVYSRLARTHRDFESMASPLEFAGAPSKEQKMKLAAESANSFQMYFEEHRIFLEAHLCADLHGFSRKLSEAFAAFRRSQDSQADAFYRAQGVDKWDEAWKVVTDEISRLRDAIEDSFRGLLGVS